MGKNGRGEPHVMRGNPNFLAIQLLVYREWSFFLVCWEKEVCKESYLKSVLRSRRRRVGVLFLCLTLHRRQCIVLAYRARELAELPPRGFASLNQPASQLRSCVDIPLLTSHLVKLLCCHEALRRTSFMYWGGHHNLFLTLEISWRKVNRSQEKWLLYRQGTELHCPLWRRRIGTLFRWEGWSIASWCMPFMLCAERMWHQPTKQK